MPCVLAYSSHERGQSGEVRGLPSPKMAATESSPHPTQADKRSPVPSLWAVHAVMLAIGVSSDLSYSWTGCPAHVGCPGGTAFKEPFFGGTPALLDCGADGLSLLDPGAGSLEARPASAASGLARPLPTIAQPQPPPAICSSTDLCAPQNVWLIKTIMGHTRGYSFPAEVAGLSSAALSSLFLFFLSSSPFRFFFFFFFFFL